MIHRRHSQPRTKRQKDAISAMFFQGPKTCEHCRQSVPRDQGDYHAVRGVVRWVCKRHVAEGIV